MAAPKEVKDIFRKVGFKFNVVMGSLKMVSGSELMIKYGLDGYSRARITINRNQTEDERKLTVLATDIMSRLAAMMTPEQETVNIVRIADYTKKTGSHNQIVNQEAVEVVE